jgi:hypothetical protein
MQWVYGFLKDEESSRVGSIGYRMVGVADVEIADLEWLFDEMSQDAARKRHGADTYPVVGYVAQFK